MSPFTDSLVSQELNAVLVVCLRDFQEQRGNIIGKNQLQARRVTLEMYDCTHMYTVYSGG